MEQGCTFSVERGIIHGTGVPFWCKDGLIIRGTGCKRKMVLICRERHVHGKGTHFV